MATTYSLTARDANIPEEFGFNIVLIKDGIHYTADRGVLEGVSRKSVIETAKSRVQGQHGGCADKTGIHR